MTYFEWLIFAANQLKESESPKRDAEILLGFVTKRSRTFLIAFSETTLLNNELAELTKLIERRKKGEPIAYIVGQKEFWSICLNVSEHTLIPRPDTEKLVELALERLPNFSCNILDLGTGSGAIALAIAKEREDCQVIAIDFCPKSLEIAKKNANNNQIKNVEFLLGSWFEPINEQLFTMIVSNPPYIAYDDEHLLKGDLKFEPKHALVAQKNGLAEIEWIIKNAKNHLKQYGWLLVEHGFQQGKSVRMLFRKEGYELVETFLDYGDNERVTIGRYF